MTWTGGQPPAEGEPVPGDPAAPYFPAPAAPLPPGAWGPSGAYAGGAPAGAPPPTGWGPPAGAWGAPPPGGWGGPPGFPELPPELKPKTGRSIVFAVIAVVLVAVIGFGSLVAYLVVTTDPSRAKAGDCIDFTEEKVPNAGTLSGDAVAEKIDCDADSAAFKVAVRLDSPDASCPGGGIYNSYVQKGGPFGRFKLCLIPNVATGDCFVDLPNSDKFDCSEGKRRDAIRVLRVVTGTADVRRCEDLPPQGLYALAYPEPPTTICYELFGASSSDGGRNT